MHIKKIVAACRDHSTTLNYTQLLSTTPSLRLNYRCEEQLRNEEDLIPSTLCSCAVHALLETSFALEFLG